MNFQYRKLVPEETELYKKFRLNAFQVATASFSESFEDEHGQTDSYFQACIGFEDEHFTLGCFTENGKLVGIATFKRDKRSKAKHKSYIHTMYVDPDYRRQKIAGTILEQILGLSRTMQDLEQIHLWVLNPERSGARALYQKYGWVGQGTIVKADLIIEGQYVDAEYMTLTL